MNTILKGAAFHLQAFLSALLIDTSLCNRTLLTCNTFLFQAFTLLTTIVAIGNLAFIDTLQILANLEILAIRVGLATLLNTLTINTFLCLQASIYLTLV